MFLSKKILSFIIGYTLTFIVYILPYDILLNLLIKKELFNYSLFLLNLFIYFFIKLIFRSIISLKLLKFIILQLMGIGCVSLSVTFLALVIIFLFEVNSFFLGIISIIIIITLCIISFLKGNSIKIKRLNLSSKKIKSELKLIFISDLHLGSNSEKHLFKIVKKIKSLNFDILIIGGDLIDSSEFDLKNLKFLKLIKKKIYFVTGNHEYYLSDWMNKLKELKKYNIKILKNKTIKFKNINIIGLDDNISIHDQKLLSNQLFVRNMFNLLIAHKPSFWSAFNDQIDLMLSGHTHNGQIFPFNLLVKLKFKNLYGLYTHRESYLYVSSGVGCWGPKMRLGTQNEIVEIFLNNE